jgi:hypothetical protein
MHCRHLGYTALRLLGLWSWTAPLLQITAACVRRRRDGQPARAATAVDIRLRPGPPTVVVTVEGAVRSGFDCRRGQTYALAEPLELILVQWFTSLHLPSMHMHPTR